MTVSAARNLREVAEKCLDWARDPKTQEDRRGLTADEAAAIQLYTKGAGLYRVFKTEPLSQHTRACAAPLTLC